MFGLFGNKAELDVVLEREAYLPGEVVNALIKVGGTKDLAIQGGRVELLWANRYTYHDSQNHRDETRSVTTTDEEIVATEHFLNEGTIRTGDVSEHAVALTIPRGTPPSGEGTITSTRWKVRAVLDIRRARDVNAEAELTMHSPIETHAQRAHTPLHGDSVKDCEMAFRLVSRHVRPGDTIEGVLLFGPSQDVDTQEVRIELVRREVVPRGEGNTDETTVLSGPIAGPNRYGGGARYEFPFRMPVPPQPFYPSLQTAQTSVHWILRAVVNRKLRSDYNLSAELNLYTGPDPAAPID